MAEINPPPGEVTAIILAGGRSERMGSDDKAWIGYKGTPLLQHAINLLSPQVDTIVISCHTLEAPYTALPQRVVADESPLFRGPLAGVMSATKEVTSEWILVVPCDMPELPANLVKRLREHLEKHDLAVAYDGTRRQHLVFMARRTTVLSIGEYIDSGMASVAGWIDCHDHIAVDFSDRREAFININWPHQLGSAE